MTKVPNTTPIESFDKRKLACPSCGSVELKTLESLLGTCEATFYADGETDFGGYTEVSWDSSETVGVECGHCAWSATDKELPDGQTAEGLLVPQGFICDHCREPVNVLSVTWIHTRTIVGHVVVEGAVECDPLDPDSDVATPVLAD